MQIRNLYYSIFVLCVTLMILLTMPACGQNTQPGSIMPVTDIDLGVTALTLDPGESYSFQITYEPADSAVRTLSWYVTDENVVRVDPMTDTVTALEEGEARIFAESMDGSSYAVCTVTVGSAISKDGSAMKSGSDVLGLSARDLKKVTAASLKDYINFLADSALGEDGLNNATP